MLNIKLIYKITGSLLFLESLFMLVCLGVAFCYKEDDVPAFLISILVTQLAAYVLRYMGREASNNMSRRDSFLVVTLAWAVFSLFGTLPYLLGGYIPSFTNAYFETMSGFTTTGATILPDVEHLPHGILFWRTLSQWIGGLGIVFFTVAILPSMVGGSVKVFAAETTGPIKTKLHPRLSTSAQSIWVIFLLLTIACLTTFRLLGMDWFSSVNYSMTTIATGGFSPHNAGIAFFRSPAMEYVSTLFCLLSGLNFMLLYRLLVRGDVGSLWKNAEARFYLAATLLLTALVALLLIGCNHYGVERAIRCALYQVVSFITTTGLYNDDTSQWPVAAWMILALGMFMGGCAGSTSGGFKAIRLLMLLKTAKGEFMQLLHPRAVLPLRLGDVNIPMQRRVTLLAFLALYLLLSFFSIMVLALAGVDVANALTITLSTLSNTGPALTTSLGPAMSWADLPDFAKWVISLLMLMGRLEIFSVLIIFTPTFWKDN